MPELPEVETTRRGIAPHVTGQRIPAVRIHNPHLRWPVPRHLPATLRGQQITTIERRAKYLLLETSAGCLILHLGMSGSLRIASGARARGCHDHFELQFANRTSLWLRDPRRFGCVLWTRDAAVHPLLCDLGPEPLSRSFDGAYLHRISRGRRLAVKNLLMDHRVVSGVGNIYANEALFASGVHPQRSAGRISRSRYDRLATATKEVLRRAIAAGGTTLKDFTREDGRPGYFRQHLRVYDRADQVCPRCGGTIRRKLVGQRATYFCAGCQR